MFSYRSPRTAAVAVAAMTALAVTLLGASAAVAAPPPPVLIVDDFEYGSGLPSGTDANGNAVGYFTFTGAGSISVSNPGTPPAPPLVANPAPNKVLQLDVDVTSYAGVIHNFENATGDAWVSQDWSEYAGFTMWLYGQNTGNTLFVDLLENRNPGSIKDDAQRWSTEFIDDFSGWKQLEIPFSSFTEKVIGNGAPRDDFDRYEMYGWAIGVLGTGGARTYYVDDVGVYGVAPLAQLEANFTTAGFSVEEGTTGDITVKLTRPLRDEDPDQVSVDYATELGTAVAGRDYTPTSGTLTFVKGGAQQLSFPLATVDDSKYQGDRQVVLRLSNPVGMPAGNRQQAFATISDNDAYDPLLLDDFETYPYLWHSDAGVELDNPSIALDDPDALPGQSAPEHVLNATLPVAPKTGVTVDVKAGMCNQGNGVIPVTLLSTSTFDATTVDPTTVMFGNAHAQLPGKSAAKKNGADANGDGRKDVVFHFRFKDTGFECGAADTPFNAQTYGGEAVTNETQSVSFGRDFAIGQNWSNAQGLSFWYYGQNSGDTVAVDLLDNRAPDPGPSGWDLAWSDEFDAAAGTAPDASKWGFELGDGTGNGNPGWGNDELQYYTNSTDNAATDGEGNMVITAKAADGSLQCYYGPCEYTSARLLSQNKAEFAYGRIESRIQLPAGDDGLWPAFWSLGTDINQVQWPQTGEIDFMEYVSRIPNTVFGTIHGPGYAGGASFGNTQTVPDLTADYHTYAVEWAPDLIKWYVDGALFHTATPADVAPNEWVFNDPVFLLLNMAIGGNFGGTVSPDLTMPQSMKIDYVRAYQGPDTAERFQAPFVDNFTGWQKVTVPFVDFTRSSDQPVGAPDDGLSLTDVWGYGFRMPVGSAASNVMLDHVRLTDQTPPSVAITDNVDADVATGDVTFTFAFSEDVGTSFTTDDVVLTGGSKGVFTRVDATHATLVAKPPADTTGTLDISVAAGAFTDLAGNANTVGASVQQAYVTPPPPPPPSGGFVITFDEPGLNTLGFDGAQDSSVVADPTDATNNVLKVVKDGGQPWAGTIVGTEPGLMVPEIPFSESDKTITVRVWSPDAGIPVRLKLEASDGNPDTANPSAETEVNTTIASGWETLTFDFANSLTAPLDLTLGYNTVVIFFDFLTLGTGKTYYADDITFPAGAGAGGGPDTLITFDETPEPVLTGFGGSVGTVVVDLADATNMVAQVIKTVGAATWAGVTISTGPNQTVPVIPLAPGSSIMTARVWSPTAGTPVRLKAEDANEVTHTVETETLTTVSGGWETLTFDFANEAPGTEPLIHPDWVFTKVSIFFDFGAEGTGATFSFDDLTWP